MTGTKQLVAGTRGSEMALVQTKLVIDQLERAHPELNISTITIVTKGDVDAAPIPLDTVGKEWFTKEIEQALLANTIDLAVHSMKDVPPEIQSGLLVMTVLKRDDPRDALISEPGTTLSTLKPGAVVGTDSLRRKALLLSARPDLQVISIRGNVNTRLQKLKGVEYDALVLAAAGMQRINRTDMITEYFDPTVFIPAVGQGALAVELHTEAEDLIADCRSIQHHATVRAVAAEQAFAKELGSGCKLPVACYARIDHDTVHIYGMVGSIDGKQQVTKSVSGRASNAIAFAQKLARELGKEPFVADYVTRR